MIVFTEQERRSLRRWTRIALKKPFGMGVQEYELSLVRRQEPVTAAGASVTSYVEKRRKRNR